MRLLSVLLIMLFLSHSAESKTRTHTFNVTGFEAYVSLFKEQAALHKRKLYMDDLIIHFNKIKQDEESGESILALCWMPQKFGDIPTIDVDPYVWKKSGMVRRILLLFHEMGHCVLYRDHEDNYSSIMNSYLLSTSQYAIDEYAYMEELFHPDKFKKKAGKK